MNSRKEYLCPRTLKNMVTGLPHVEFKTIEKIILSNTMTKNEVLKCNRCSNSGDSCRAFKIEIPKIRCKNLCSDCEHRLQCNAEVMRKASKDDECQYYSSIFDNKISTKEQYGVNNNELSY